MIIHQGKETITYIASWGFSINEGGTPFNIHMSWHKGFFIYVYLFGKRFSWYSGRKILKPPKHDKITPEIARKAVRSVKTKTEEPKK